MTLARTLAVPMIAALALTACGSTDKDKDKDTGDTVETGTDTNATDSDDPDTGLPIDNDAYFFNISYEFGIGADGQFIQNASINGNAIASTAHLLFINKDQTVACKADIPLASADLIFADSEDESTDTYFGKAGLSFATWAANVGATGVFHVAEPPTGITLTDAINAGGPCTLTFDTNFQGLTYPPDLASMLPVGGPVGAWDTSVGGTKEGVASQLADQLGATPEQALAYVDQFYAPAGLAITDKDGKADYVQFFSLYGYEMADGEITLVDDGSGNLSISEIANTAFTSEGSFSEGWYIMDTPWVLSMNGDE